MDGFPVVIRTLDPPLHEFLPKRKDLMVDVANLPYADIKKKRVDVWLEVTMDDRNAPATKGDIADIMEALRDVETKLLNAFYGYAKSNDKRVLETEGNEGVLRSRVATLETRLTDVEHRLNMPPQQQ